MLSAQLAEVTSFNLDNPIQILPSRKYSISRQCWAHKPVSSTRLSHAASCLSVFFSSAASHFLSVKHFILQGKFLSFFLSFSFLLSSFLPSLSFFLSFLPSLFPSFLPCSFLPSFLVYGNALDKRVRYRWHQLLSLNESFLINQ